jgi:hypothetical protein
MRVSRSWAQEVGVCDGRWRRARGGRSDRARRSIGRRTDGSRDPEGRASRAERVSEVHLGLVLLYRRGTGEAAEGAPVMIRAAVWLAR